MAHQKYSLLITSMGSLVGQNIIEMLQGRRDAFYLIGLNTETNNPMIYQCDEVWKCPPAASDAYIDFLLRIIRDTEPDFVLPGRDEDVGILATIRQCYPEWSSRFPVGTPQAAAIMDDKHQSAAFALDQGLPFARSIDPVEFSEHQLRIKLEGLGFSMIAKPRAGFGSHGVKYILNIDQAILLGKLSPGEYVFQELIDPPAGFSRHLDRYMREMEAGIPAFIQLPDDRQYAGQCMIGPEGDIGHVFCSRSTMVIGRCERAEAINNAGMSSVVHRFATAMAGIGWRGVFNIQGRMSDRGFIPIEMNGRFSGSTSARGWMGYDEIRALYWFFKGIDIGPNPERPDSPTGLVHRVLSDRHVRYSDIETLDQTGHWKASGGR